MGTNLQQGIFGCFPSAFIFHPLDGEKSLSDFEVWLVGFSSEKP